MVTQTTEHVLHDAKLWDGHHAETIEATVDTDANGDGTLAGVALKGDYASTPIAVVDADQDGDGGASVANKTTDTLDIVVTGSTTVSGTVTVLVLVEGPKN